MQQGEEQQTTSTALSVALKHAVLSTDPRILCAAARTCKAWREAVQQCNVCNTAVEVSLDSTLSRLCSLSRWLPKHAALVKTIMIKRQAHSGRQELFLKAPEKVDDLQWELHLEAAQLLLQQAMRLAAVPAAAAGVSVAAVAEGHETTDQQQQQLASLRLLTISSSTLIDDISLLAALPAHSLTHLDLCMHQLQGAVDGQAVSAALARLSNLQQLRAATAWRDYESSAPFSCLAGVAQLTRLTSFEVTGYWSGSVDQLQQLLAQPLPLRVLRLCLQSTLPSQLDLSHLTQLEELACIDPFLDAVFPPQLQQLVLPSVSSERMLQSLMQLQQLRRLRIAAMEGEGQPQPLLLAQLPALQQLALGYNSARMAAAAAPAWPRLPQLRDLAIHSYGGHVSRSEWQAIIDGVAASANLTKLELALDCLDDDVVAIEGDDEVDGEDGDEDDAEVEGEVDNEVDGDGEVDGEGDGEDDEPEVEDGTWMIAPCAKLAGLRQLKHLRLRGSSCPVAPGDALALTVLTGLTFLQLAGLGAGAGDSAAAALACSCQQLRDLDLRGCDLVSMACLEPVRHLTQLTRLRLAFNRQLTQHELMLLTELRCLQDLEVDVASGVRDELLESFWAAVRSGQQ